LAIIYRKGVYMPGVDLVGFLTGEFGLGEAGRLLANTLRRHDVPVSTINMVVPNHRYMHPFHIDNVWRHKIMIASVNSTEMPLIAQQHGSDVFRERHVIGQWFWELEDTPSPYRVGYQFVNELWAPTKFIQHNVSKYAPANVEVHHMPLPLVAPVTRKGVTKDQFGLDQDRFTFLFTFDFCSTEVRKNPAAVIDAFKTAFRENEGPVLVIKSLNDHLFPNALRNLMARADKRSDIKFLNQHLDHDLVSALRSACDCYVSLHRSEGLGLTISEAMCLGKPVIATAYSGNMDFMTEDNSIPVPWEYTHIQETYGPYEAGMRWAEPNTAFAADAMRRLYNDPVAAEKLGKKAQEDMANLFSFEVTGQRMVDRLSKVEERYL
jgi:glycosyltransferase involved in cell wall biosynthesis